MEDSTEIKKRTPGTIFQFSDSTCLESTAVPVIPGKRKCTDTAFLIIFLIFLLLLIPLSAIFSVGTDINRFLYGYDKCGNTCGVKNVPIYGINCSGQDTTEKRIALMKYHPINRGCVFNKNKIVADKCVEYCNPPNQLIFHRCYPPDDVILDADSKSVKQMTEILHAINESLATITVMSFTGLVMTFGIFVSFRCHVPVTFWTLVIFQLVVLLAVTTFLWHRYITSDKCVTIYLLFALASSGYLIFLILFIIFLHSTFPLIFRLYDEAMNAIFRIPSILIQPLLTIFVFLVMVISMVFLIFLMSSKEYLVPYNEDLSAFKYSPSFSTLLYIFYVVVMMMWVYAFTDGCQSVLISGAVSKYYFAKNKFNLDSPYYNSFIVLIRHHLGTVACGSLVVTLVSFMRGISEYMINKAYIQTAMHGTPLYKSSVCAVKLLTSNIINTVTITGFNYIVINGFTFLSIIVSLVAGLWMNSDYDFSYHFWMGLVFGAATTGLVTFFTMGAMIIATETVFLCFCEDQLSNDSNNRQNPISLEHQKPINGSQEIKTTV